MTNVKCFLSFCVAAMSLGCFAYIPVDLETVPVGTRVRARLSAEGQNALRDRSGLDIGELNGTLVEKRGDNVLFSVRSAQGISQFGAPVNLYQRIDVPSQDILQVDVKKLDKLKTGALVAGLTGAVTVATILALEGGERGSRIIPPSGPEDRRQASLILLRVPLSLWLGQVRW